MMKKKGLLCLLTAGMMAFSACGNTGTDGSNSNFNDEVVMTIDGNEIMKSEYMVYLYTTTKSFTAVGQEDIWTMDFDGQTADELVAERTLKTLQSVVAANKYAKENNLTLTDEQKAEAVEASNQFVLNIPEEDLQKMGVDEEKLIPFMEGSYMYSLVYQALAAECEVDEAEMAKYYEENKVQMKDDYTLLDLDTIVLDNLETANEVVAKARAGEDFDTLFNEYDIYKQSNQEDDGSLTLYKTQFASSFGVTDVPEAGTIMEPVLVDGVYFVIEVDAVTLPEDSEIKTVAENSFKNLKQSEYSDARFEEMMAAQSVEFVEDVYAGLEKFHE